MASDTANAANTEGSMSRKDAMRLKDEALLATLGYKQEFKRAFKPLEVRNF